MSVQMCKNTENWPEKEFVCEAITCVKNTKRNKNNYLIIRGHTKALVSFQCLNKKHLSTTFFRKCTSLTKIGKIGTKCAFYNRVTFDKVE